MSLLGSLQRPGAACSISAASTSGCRLCLACPSAGPSHPFGNLKFRLLQVHAESLEWINTTILEFGLQACGKNLLEMAKTSLGSPNAAVRTSATKLLGTMYRTLGSGVVEALRPSVKPALLAAIEAECPSTIEPPPEPIRTARSGVPAVAKKAAGGGSKAAAEKATGAAKNRNGAFAAGGDDDMLPRADISGKITGDLVKSLGSSTWKERQSAVDQVPTRLCNGRGRHIGLALGSYF